MSSEHDERILKVRRSLESFGLEVESSGVPTADIYLPQARAHVSVLKNCGQKRAKSPADVQLLEVYGTDSLSLIYLRQKIYQLLMGYTLPPAESAPVQSHTPQQTEAVRRNILYAFDELAELLHEFPWKWHRDAAPAVDKKRVVGEFGDLFVFLLNVLAQADVSEAELVAGLADVQQKNFRRWREGVNRRTGG